MKPFLRALLSFVKGMIRDTWPMFFGFVMGGLCTAAQYRLDLLEAATNTFADAATIFILATVCAFAWCFSKAVRFVIRERGFVPITLIKKKADGAEIFRTDLHIPREWKRLPNLDLVRRVEAQLKGQGPF